MKEETRQWLKYADENIQSSKILLESHLYNPSLQNAQQTIEKYIKAYFIENHLKLQKTHNILSLNEILKQNGIFLNITDDEIDLIDTIYHQNIHLVQYYQISNLMTRYVYSV